MVSPRPVCSPTKTSGAEPVQEQVREIRYLQCKSVTFFRYISERWRTAELFTTVNLPCCAVDRSVVPAEDIHKGASAQPAADAELVHPSSKRFAMAADAADHLDQSDAGSVAVAPTPIAVDARTDAHEPSHQTAPSEVTSSGSSGALDSHSSVLKDNDCVVMEKDHIASENMGSPPPGLPSVSSPPFSWCFLSLGAQMMYNSSCYAILLSANITIFQLNKGARLPSIVLHFFPSRIVFTSLHSPFFPLKFANHRTCRCHHLLPTMKTLILRL